MSFHRIPHAMDMAYTNRERTVTHVALYIHMCVSAGSGAWRPRRRRCSTRGTARRPSSCTYERACAKKNTHTHISWIAFPLNDDPCVSLRADVRAKRTCHVYMCVCERETFLDLIYPPSFLYTFVLFA